MPVIARPATRNTDQSCEHLLQKLQSHWQGTVLAAVPILHQAVAQSMQQTAIHFCLKKQKIDLKDTGHVLCIFCLCFLSGK